MTMTPQQLFNAMNTVDKLRIVSHFTRPGYLHVPFMSVIYEYYPSHVDVFRSAEFGRYGDFRHVEPPGYDWHTYYIRVLALAAPDGYDVTDAIAYINVFRDNPQERKA